MMLLLPILSFLSFICCNMLNNADIPQGQNRNSQIKFNVYRFKNNITNPSDSLYYLIDFADTLNFLEYYEEGGDLFKEVYLDGISDENEGDFIWRTNVNGEFEFGSINYKLPSDDYMALNALNQFIATHSNYHYFIIPFIMGIWGYDGTEIIHLSLFNCKTNRSRVKLSPHDFLNISEPTLSPTKGPFNDWLIQNILSGLPRSFTLVDNEKGSYQGKDCYLYNDIVIVTQSGQNLFLDIIEKVGFENIINLQLGVDPIHIVGYLK